MYFVSPLTVAEKEAESDALMVKLVSGVCRRKAGLCMMERSSHSTKNQHQQIVEILASPCSGALPRQGILAPYNLLPTSSAAIIPDYNPLSTPKVMIITKFMFLPHPRPGLVLWHNVLSRSYRRIITMAYSV